MAQKQIRAKDGASIFARICAARLGDRGGSGFEVFPKAVGEFGAVFIGHTARGALHLFDKAVQITARTGDGDDAEGGGLPCDGFVELGNRDVEALAQLILQRADDLAAVLERLRVFDAEFEGEMGYGHGAGCVVT